MSYYLQTDKRSSSDKLNKKSLVSEVLRSLLYVLSIASNYMSFFFPFYYKVTTFFFMKKNKNKKTSLVIKRLHILHVWCSKFETCAISLKIFIRMSIIDLGINYAQFKYYGSSMQPI
jgi:hypothetical protein